MFQTTNQIASASDKTSLKWPQQPQECITNSAGLTNGK
jgi:hypothetical protein